MPMIEVLALVCTIVGLFLVAKKSGQETIGFLMGAVGNAAWIMAFPHIASIVFINLLLGAANMLGFINYNEK